METLRVFREEAPIISLPLLRVKAPLRRVRKDNQVIACIREGATCMWRSEIAMQTSKPTLPQLATIVLFFLYVLIACPPRLRAQTQVDIERTFRSLTWSTESTGLGASSTTLLVYRRSRYRSNATRTSWPRVRTSVLANSCCRVFLTALSEISMREAISLLARP